MSPHVNRYFKINELYFNDNNFIDTGSYGVRRQHSLISPSATTNNYSTFFDTSNKKHFLNYTLSFVDDTKSDPLYTLKTPFQTTKNTLNALSLLNPTLNDSSKSSLLNVFNFPNVVSEINSDSDGSVVSKPTLKLTNVNLGKGYSYDWSQFRNTNFLKGRGTANLTSTLKPTNVETNKVLSSAGANTKILPSDQSVRQYSNVKSTQSHYNLSEGTNLITSNTFLLNKTNPSSSLATNYLGNKADNPDLSVVNHVLSNRDFMEGPHYPNRSNNPMISRTDYNSMTADNTFTASNRSVVTTKVFTKNLDTVDLLQGAREKAPASINASY